MDNHKSQPSIEMMKALVDPWHQSLANPARAQEIVLEGLLKGYNQTDYGQQYNSEKVGSYGDFINAFPVQTYDGFKPYIDEVMAGNTHALLSEEPLYIGLTKGTSGQPKMFPITTTQANVWKIVTPRILFNYSLFKQDFKWLSGARLNLVSSGNVGTIKVGEKEMKYGFSVAVISKLAEENGERPLKAIPSGEEMDTLPKEPSKQNWEARYEFVYEKARGQNATYIITTPDVVVGFGRYLNRKHHVNPKDLWQITYIMSGGFPNTHTRFTPIINALYGKSADVRETYVATEGAFGTQIDDKKAWSPFYDQMFFEVQTPGGIKPLYDMYPGEIGGLIVSTPSLPRYRNEDLVLAFEPPYFRCIGREKTKLHPYQFGKLTGKSYFSYSKSKDLIAWR